MPILITKEDGMREPFDAGKLRFSLERAGAASASSDRIIAHIEGELVDGMSTAEIYRHAFNLLRRDAKPVAARYSMRRAVLDLGPTGFPFETFIGEMFKVRGYQVHTDQIIRGACVDHEVDMVAQKKGDCIAAEIKFHNSLSIKSDVQTPLYIHARFEDLKKGRSRDGNQFCIDRGMLVTNTKFTNQAIAYGSCVGLLMIGWNHPREGSLHDLIEETKVHPITALTTLSHHEKMLLLERRVVISKTLLEDHGVLASIGLTPQKIEDVLIECGALSQ